MVGSGEWYLFLVEGRTFYYESNLGTFTARKEARPGGRYWYAWRKHKGHLYKSYLGPSGELNLARLNEVAQVLDQKTQVSAGAAPEPPAPPPPPRV